MFSDATKLAVFLCALSGNIFFACGASEEEVTMAQADKKPVGVGNTSRANAELEEAVRAKLDSDEQLKKANLAVEADVTRNQVTLSGAVPSEALRDKAVELTKSAHAGVIVAEKISVKSKITNSMPAPARRGAVRLEEKRES
jgi:osmotically-inducible protein OsmY